MTDGGARVGWLWGMTARRWRAQWRLVIAVLSATVLASTLVTALGLVVSTTEQSGVSAALGDLRTEQARVAVTLRDPAGPVASTAEATTIAVSDVLGSSVPLDVSTTVVTTRVPTPLGVAYFAEGASGVELLSGEWPTSSSTVAIPSALGLAVGADVSVGATVFTVSGTYAVTDLRDEFWRDDFLRGAGAGSDEETRVVGPLLLATGGVDAAGLAPSVVRVFIDPDLSVSGVAELEPLITRLDAAGIDVPRDLRAVAGSRSYESRLDEAVESVASGLIVTRSTVIVVSLLLLVLAVAAIAQAARLLVDAREPESELLRSRGASRRQLLVLAGSEAVALGVITAAVSPALAALAYRAFAATPLASSAGVPTEAQLGPLTWLTAAAVSLVFVVILVAPAVMREFATDDETKTRGPQRAARTGIDIALLVIAVLAYFQLQLYKSPVDASTSLGIDPILVAGPAIALLAGALASMRLLGPVARLINLAGSRSTGIVLPLVSWEIGRRAQRSAAAVLLLSLSLAVGTFSISFLSTWQQSQVDQAELAVGAPARTVDEPGDVAASPVLRASGRLGGDDTAGSAPGTAAQVLGLTADGRALLNRGRVGDLGGGVISSRLDAVVAPSSGPELDGDALTATVRIGPNPHPEATASVTAIVEDRSGVLHGESWGEVPVDGLEHAVTAAVDTAGARLVGVTVTFAAGNGSPQAENVEVAVTDLSLAQSVATEGWYFVAADGSSREVSMPGDGSLVVEGTVPGVSGVQSSTLATVGWKPAEVVQAVIPAAAAKTQKLVDGDRLTLVVNGAPVRIEVAGWNDVVPGSASFARVRAGDVGVTPTVVVDQVLLQRALAASGELGDFADEWWVDAPPGTGHAFVESHDDAVSSEALARELQESPLRVATPATLWTAIAAGGLLAAIGFLMHTTMSLRGRRLELAQLGAIGVSRSRLRVLVTAEALVVGALGAVFGLVIGVLLALLIGPLVAASPTGEPPVPAVVVHLPWAQFLVLDLCVALVLGAVVSGVARGRAFVHPAELLRGARE